MLRCIERLAGGVIVGSSCCVGIKAPVASYHHFVNWLYTSVRLCLCYCHAMHVRARYPKGNVKRSTNGDMETMSMYKDTYIPCQYRYKKKTFTLPFSHCLSLSHVTHTYTKDTHTHTRTHEHTHPHLYLECTTA